jgi:RHS repeat-associated protein
MSLSTGRFRVSLLALVALVAVLSAMLTGALSAPKPAEAAATGSGGRFVATSGRILDTTDGTGGYSTPMAANTYRTVQVTGLAGVPTSGVAAVTVLATADLPSGVGQLVGRPDSSTASTLMTTYGGGDLGTTSNTATIAVSSSGTIQVMANTDVSLILDVEGYYSSSNGGVAPGGFVSVPGTRIVDTRNGTGAPEATIGSGQTLTVQVSGAAGVPSGASGVVANFLVVNETSTKGYITPYPTGATAPVTSMNYAAGSDVPTSDTAQVALSSSGQVTVSNTGSSAIDLVVDVEGYFTAADSGGVFTPDAERLYDTRVSPNTTFASNEQRAVPIAGQGSVPAMGSGISAVAITLTTLHAADSTGNTTVWADGTTKPATTAINFTADSIRSDLVIVPLGSDGKIDLDNISEDTSNFVIDVQGWYNSLPTGPSTTNLTGSRPSATALPFPIDDQTTTSVDVATGNLSVSNQGLTLPTLTGSATFGASYNSRGWEAENSANIDANKWAYDLDSAGSLSANAAGVVYTASDGSTDQFTLNADGSYTAASGIEASLSSSSAGYTLSALVSRSKVTFNLSGQPTGVFDKNGNKVTFNYNTSANKGFLLSSVVSNAGPAASTSAANAAVSVAYSNGTTTITQANSAQSWTRSISYTKDSNGNLTSYTDGDGKTTTFGYSGTDLTSITAPEGGRTTFAYNSSDQVTSVTQPASTGSGTAVTRFSYASSTSTQVASPTTSQSTAVASVPHTTYTINSNHLVTNVANPDGLSESSTYGTTSTTNTEIANETVGATAGSETEQTNTYGANNNQSLTKSASSSDSGTAGTSSSATYSSTSEYQPASTTDGNGNTLYSGYDASGNQLSSSNTAPGSSSSSSTATATLTYNSTTSTYPYPGTVSTATNALGGRTSYAYNSTGQLSSITPPSGSSLGVKNYTYDPFGRLSTETDGAGHTTTYTYDNDDRILTEAFSDGTHTVSNNYDDNGNQINSTSATGTITNTYDPDNRLLSTVNSAGGGTVSYGYDLAGNETSTTDTSGTVTYTYDQANVLWAMTYPHGSGTETDRYKIDDHGRRTDAYVAAGGNGSSTTNATNTAPATFAGHTKTTYTASTGHVSEIVAYTGQDATKVFDTTYDYTGPVTGSQTDQIQKTTDTLSGKVTTYSYNTDGRLTGATQSGGSSDWNWSYTYDKDGNRLTADQSGAYTSAFNLTYNNANQITSTGYSYDGDGNLTAAPDATYTYNGAEQMTRSVVNGLTTNYTYAGASEDQLLTDDSSDGNYTFTYGKQSSEGVPVIDTLTSSEDGTGRVLSDGSTGQALDLSASDGTTGAYVYDGENNQIAVIADTGVAVYKATYDPYGTGGNSSITDYDFYTENPYGFVAGTTTTNADPGSLTKFGARWYLANQGSWTQMDTLDSPLDPSDADRYAYADDDPVNSQDPSGLLSALTKSVVSGCLAGAAKSAVVGAIFAPALPAYLGGIALGCAVGGTAELMSHATGIDEVGAGMEIGYTTLEFAAELD